MSKLVAAAATRDFKPVALGKMKLNATLNQTV